MVLEPLMVKPSPERLLPIGPHPKGSRPFVSKQLSMGSLGPGMDFRHRTPELRQTEVFLLEASKAIQTQARRVLYLVLVNMWWTSFYGKPREKRKVVKEMFWLSVHPVTFLFLVLKIIMFSVPMATKNGEL